MSGAKPLKTVWKERAEKAVGEGGASTTVYVADLAGQGLKSMPGLRVDGQRGVRASFPNRCVLPNLGRTLAIPDELGSQGFGHVTAVAVAKLATF